MTNDTTTKPRARAPKTPTAAPLAAATPAAATPAPATPKSAPAAAVGQTKSATVIKLLLRAKGATPLELIAATDWQPHSLRAFLSGLRKKGRVIAREPRKSGEAAYRIIALAEGSTSSSGTVPDADGAVGEAVRGDGASPDMSAPAGVDELDAGVAGVANDIAPEV